jgi:hypothetical protein
MPNTDRLRRFIADFTSLVGGAVQDRDEAAIIAVGHGLLKDLVTHDDWLPESMAKCCCRPKATSTRSAIG